VICVPFFFSSYLIADAIFFMMVFRFFGQRSPIALDDCNQTSFPYPSNSFPMTSFFFFPFIPMSSRFACRRGSLRVRWKSVRLPVSFRRPRALMPPPVYGYEFDWSFLSSSVLNPSFLLSAIRRPPPRTRKGCFQRCCFVAGCCFRIMFFHSVFRFPPPGLLPFITF